MGQVKALEVDDDRSNDPDRVAHLEEKVGKLDNSYNKLIQKENTREWIKLAISILAAVPILFGILAQISNFMELKAAENKLQLNKEIISVTTALSKASGNEAANAAVLLSTLGYSASPLLIYHLDNTNITDQTQQMIQIGIQRIIQEIKSDLNSLGFFQSSKRAAYKDQLANISELLIDTTLKVLSKQFDQDGILEPNRITPYLKTMSNIIGKEYCNTLGRKNVLSQIKKYQTNLAKMGDSELEELKSVFSKSVQNLECETKQK